MQVSEIMVEEPVTITEDATLHEAVALMDEHGIRHLPVVRQGRLLGVLSDRDLLVPIGWLVPAVSHEGELQHGLVRHCMQPKPLTVEPGDTLLRAGGLLTEYGVSCLPVLEKKALVGVLTTIDLLDAFVFSARYGRQAGEKDPPVRELMSTELTTVAPETTLEEMAELLRKADFRHLPVVENGKLVGLLSDRDLRRALGRDASPEAPARELMTKNVGTIGPETRVSRAARQMLVEKIGALPVVGTEGRLEGLTTVSDVLGHCVRVLG